MKELTIEEKAKRYDEAKCIMEKYLKSGNAGVIAENTIKKAFPELKESEDERIRRKLIKALKECGFTHFNDEFTVQEALDWLEGQGEQKPADKIEHKFKVGDIIRLKGGTAEYTIKRVTDTTYYTIGWSCSIEKCEEDYELVEQKSNWSEEDETLLSWCISDIERAKYCKSQTKPGLCDNEINWLKSLKDRVQPQPKQGWSEEDEYYLNSCITKIEIDIQNWEGHGKTMIDADKEKISWLKSLKDRYTWKPSEEEMKALRAINVTGGVSYAGQSQELINLYQDLYTIWKEKEVLK